ncbi:GNAT family N-acetyltransferase [Streptomyces sp. UNOC14_S4]|uniref:GNAT family N-acetyltransferase n=1 Tax=Streptomyces sp. UNOC14_S4 TaxID=2872340 RepID=UPI001E5E5583|nr:GNAT family N-acetyltransferase [Streptomyces sp. UNOC14_S4]MCC3771028.1 GNAT family N-acetyltransferase [Streptomyces sp. UNOC14_S4]
MTDETRAKGVHAPHHWRRDLAELAAVFTAVAAADSVANTVVHGPDGPVLLVASAAALLATTGFHAWWARRRHDRAGTVVPTVAAPAPTATETAATETALWRMRTTVRDEPGSLAALCVALAHRRVDILSLQTHPLGDGTVDELLLRAPGALTSRELTEAAGAGGGRGTWLERADAHDLVDAPTRALTLATRTALDGAELPLALRQLFGRCTIRSVPARDGDADASVPPEGMWEETVMRLRDPAGGSITIERPYLPFTPTEFARARALVELDARLGPRVPPRSDVLTLAEGNEITVRRAGPADLAAAREMHGRCSARTLSRRYHGPVGDADRYLTHLLGPRFGRTLGAFTASGRLVALAHLLWDGEETEVSLLVEDAWQRRGVGGELLGRLVGMAAEAGCESVYAVTQASNTAMVAAMRSLGLPLDYLIEEGTLVVTARLAPVPPTVPSTVPLSVPPTAAARAARTDVTARKT